MTDGQHNTGIDPEVVAGASPTNFIIHTITFGDGADQVRTQDIASTRNGEHFHAPDSVTIAAIFQQIAATLPVILAE